MMMHNIDSHLVGAQFPVDAHTIALKPVMGK